MHQFLLVYLINSQQCIFFSTSQTEGNRRLPHHQSQDLKCSLNSPSLFIHENEMCIQATLFLKLISALIICSVLNYFKNLKLGLGRSNHKCCCKVKVTLSHHFHMIFTESNYFTFILFCFFMYEMFTTELLSADWTECSRVRLTSFLYQKSS